VFKVLVCPTDEKFSQPSLDIEKLSRDGCTPTIGWLFPDGMFTSFSYQLTTLLTEITQQISTLHEAIEVGTIWTWVDAEKIR
jgi:hypothetical protein